MSSKPSTAANLILLTIVIGVLAGIGGLGWWGYKKFIATDSATPTPAQADSTPQAPDKDAAAKELAAKEAAAKEAAGKELAAKEAAAKELAAKEAAAKELAAKELAAKEAALKQQAAMDAVSKEAAKELAAKEAAVKEAAMKEAAAKELAAKETAAKETASNDAAMKEAAAKEMAAKELAAKEAAAKEQAAKEAAAKELAAKEAAAKAAEAGAFKVFAIDSPEGKALLEDAERRIEEAPEEVYSKEKKILVRKGLRSARSLARVTTIFYEAGKVDVNEAASQALTDGLKGAESKAILKNPKAVVFAIGFSDPSGSATSNQNLAKDRAEGVKKFLGEKRLINNDVHAIGIGSTEVVSEGNKDKNRATEVWIVIQ